MLKALHLRETLSEIGDMLRRLIGDDIQLKMQCDADVGHVRFDPAQFEQVMVNLALNARDAMPSGGQLQIVATNFSVSQVTKNGADDLAPGDYVRIEVADNGTRWQWPNFDAMNHRLTAKEGLFDDTTQHFVGAYYPPQPRWFLGLGSAALK